MKASSPRHYHIVEPGGSVRLHAYRNRRQAESHRAMLPARWLLAVERNTPCKHCARLKAASNA